MTSRDKPVKAGVVGCGFFGSLHAQKYVEAEHAELVGVYDVSAAAATALAHKLGTRAFTSASDLMKKIDAVSVTVPAAVHYDVAANFLRGGVHVLVEKPIALHLAHADELIDLADAGNLVLQVGHQERYVFEDFGVLHREQSPQEIRARRTGPFTGRAMDVSAIFDLMIHDLDLVHQVSPADVVEIEASSKAIHGTYADEVAATLTLSDGCKVYVLASRIADARQRDMRLVYPDGVVEIDFVNRTLKNSTKTELRSGFDGSEISQRILNDPLGYGINAFIDSVRLGTPPLVTGRQARQALATAIRISEALAA